MFFFGQCSSVCDKISLAAEQEPHFQLIAYYYECYSYVSHICSIKLNYRAISTLNLNNIIY